MYAVDPVIDAAEPAPISSRNGSTAARPYGIIRPVPAAPAAVTSVP